MKTFIAILLGCSLALSTGTAANRDANKKPAKSKAPPKQKTSHVNAAPRVNNAPKSQAKVNRAPSTEKHTKPKTHESSVANEQVRKQNHVSKEQLRKSPNAPAAELPAVQNVNKSQVNRKVAPLPKESIERIQAQHRNFKAVPNPKIASAQFNQNYRIAGAQNWTGPQYRVFSEYRPEWHDHDWWQTRYAANLLLIGGGWYYWNAGYWYPAWGYDQAAAYYPYDGPIYVGDHQRPFDQVVADVQATLQEQGYYKGDVDGLMGPLTREALANFQRDNGLVTTAALDQPTLSTLGLG